MSLTSVLIYVNCPSQSDQLHTKSASTSDVFLRGSFLVAIRLYVTRATGAGLARLIPMGQTGSIILGLVRLLSLVVSASCIQHSRLVANEALEFLVTRLIPGITFSKLGCQRLNSLGNASHCMTFSCYDCGRACKRIHSSSSEVHHALVPSSHVGMVKFRMGGCCRDQPLLAVSINKYMFELRPGLIRKGPALPFTNSFRE
jgi:hypothetical protein